LEETGERKAFQLLLKETSPKLDAMLGASRAGLDGCNGRLGGRRAEEPLRRSAAQEGRDGKEEQWLVGGEEDCQCLKEATEEGRRSSGLSLCPGGSDLTAGDALQVCLHEAGFIADRRQCITFKARFFYADEFGSGNPLLGGAH